MSKTILIVDDEPNNLHLLRGVLSTEGYKLVFATDGEKALRSVEKHKPDLLLLDIMMPNMDGYQVCKILKEDNRYKDIPIIFVTAMSDVVDENRGFEVGCVDYISKPISPSIVIARVKTHLSLIKVEQLEKLAVESIKMLGEAGHYNDNDTGEHIWRMASYARCIARNAGYNNAFIDLLYSAAPMHDTGKIGIPDQILKAPRKLTLEEWDIMKTHSKIGSNILSKSNNPVFQMASEIALNHHEKYDGSGYPYGLKGKEIPDSARIVSIADVFDALTMRRPYKEAWSTESAINEIVNNSGVQFDPDLVNVFVNSKDEIIDIMNKMK